MSSEAITTIPSPSEPPVVVTPAPPLPPTPWTWRAGIAAGIVLVGSAAYLLHEMAGPRIQAFAGVFCFFGIVALFSTNLRAVSWRTIGCGIGLQLVLAVLVLKVDAVYELFHEV